jgi:hypothetical protein
VARIKAGRGGDMLANNLIGSSLVALSALSMATVLARANWGSSGCSKASVRPYMKSSTQRNDDG